jgi:hypothetical protein
MGAARGRGGGRCQAGEQQRGTGDEAVLARVLRVVRRRRDAGRRHQPPRHHPARRPQGQHAGEGSLRHSLARLVGKSGCHCLIGETVCSFLLIVASRYSPVGNPTHIVVMIGHADFGTTDRIAVSVQCCSNYDYPSIHL